MTASAARDLEQIAPALGPWIRIDGSVAGPAILGPEMGPFEVGAGLAVVEARGIEGDDGRLPALMLGVANGAVVGLVPVVPFLSGDPGGDLDMTGQAPAGGNFARCDMARRAVCISGLERVGRAQGIRDILRFRSRAPNRSGGRGYNQGKKRKEGPFRFHSYYYDISYTMNKRLSNDNRPAFRTDSGPGFH